MADLRDRFLALVPNLGVLAVVLAVGVSLLGGLAPKPADKKADPAKPEAKAEADVPAVALTPAQFLQRMNLHPSPAQLTAAAFARFAPQHERLLPLTDEFATYRKRCECLIVTVPDPVETQFGFWFDQCVEAVQRAMNDAGVMAGDKDTGGYTQEHHWFPWKTGSAKADPTKDSPDPRRHPGVIVFRHGKEWHRKRVVLLVGENPVSGIHPEALRQAFELADRLDGSPPDDKGGRRVRVVGPFFTGGQPSLAQGITDWSSHDTGRRVRAISGGAIGLKQPSELTLLNHPPRPLIEVYDQNATRVPADTIRRAILHYLAMPGRTNPEDEFGPGPAGVAYLIEANSGFGDGVASGVNEAAEKKRVSPPPILRFPLHLSRLTGIQTKERRERDERLGLRPPGGSKLLALDEARSGADSLPAADEARTALLNQALLTDFWAVLKRERVRYLGVVATDPRDKLFLIEQLREHCPTVQPFVTGHDVHFSHPEYAAALRGTLVVGEYPLYPPAQRWAQRPDDPRRLAFASATAEGTYNATLTLLGRDDRLLDYASPAWDRPKTTVPPIWVSVVAEDGELVPLAYFTNYDASPRDRLLHRPERPPPPDTPYTPPRRFALWVVAVGVLLAAGYAAYLLRRNRQFWRFASPARGRMASAGAWVAVGLATAAVPLGVYAVAVGYLAPHEFWGEAAAGWLILTAAAATAGGVAAVTAERVRRYVWLAGWPLLRPLLTRGVRPRGPAADEAWTAVYAAVVLAGGLGLLGWVGVSQLSATRPQQVLFVERAGWVADGSSVLVPAVLLALALFAYGARRLAAAGRRAEAEPGAGADDVPYPVLPAGSPDSTFREQFTLVRDQARRFDGTVFDLGYMVRQRWRTKVVLAVVAAGVIAYLCLRGRGTWEGRAWDWLFLIGFVAAAVLAVRSAVRLWAAWHALEKILRTVARIPMVGAFDRLPDKVARVLADYLVTQHRRRSDLAISNHLLRLLRRAVDDPPGGAKPPGGGKSGGGAKPPADDGSAEVGRLLSPRLSLWDHATPPADESDELPSAREDQMASLSRQLVERLAPGWTAASVLDAFGKRPDKEPKDSEFDAGWRPIAEQFVAIQVVSYLARFFARMRHLASVAILTTACLLVAVTEFPFQPERVIVGAAVGVAAFVTGSILWVLVGINRNEIVSRVTRTSPDKLTLDGKFLTNVFQFVVPLAALVVVQLSGRLRSVFEPVLELFR